MDQEFRAFSNGKYVKQGPILIYMLVKYKICIAFDLVFVFSFFHNYANSSK